MAFLAAWVDSIWAQIQAKKEYGISLQLKLHSISEMPTNSQVPWSGDVKPVSGLSIA